MPARREGMVITKGPDKWLVRWFVGTTANGRNRYRSRLVRGNKRVAERALREVLASRDHATYVEPSRIPLDEYLDRWLSAMRDSVAPRTHDLYERLLRKHVRPVLGTRPLQQLGTLDVQHVIDGMKGLSPETRRKTHRILGQALRQAVEWNLLPRDPSKGVKLPKKATKEWRAFTLDEVQRFRKAATGTRHAMLWEFLLATGCRPQEALGLRWRNVDFKAGLVHIRQVLTLDGNMPVLGPPKTEGSRRTISLPGPTLAALQAHRKQQRAEIALRADLKREVAPLRGEQELGLVFERHLPESVRLYRHAVRRGLAVEERGQASGQRWRVVKVQDGVATLRGKADRDEPVEASRPIEDVRGAGIRVVMIDLWNLYHGMRRGDLVILRGDSRRRLVMEIDGPYDYAKPAHPHRDYQHTRAARPRSDLDPDVLWRRAGAKEAKGENGYWTLHRLPRRVRV